jgi:hypothetical protein
MRLIGEHLLRSRYQLPKLYAAKIIELTIKDELMQQTWTMMMKEHQRYRALTLRLVESSGQLFLFKRNYTS